MVERTGYASGTPAWVDLSADVEGAVAFYGPLFGWEAIATGTVEETGGYKLFTKDGKVVAGVGPQQAQDQPVYWTTYVSVDDADAVTAKVRDAGGQVLMEPFAVMDQGRMGVYLDPQGAAFAVWEPQAMTGAQLVNEPGSLSWNELNTRDVEGAKAFYGAVFGWGEHTEHTPAGGYTEWLLGDAHVGGARSMEGMPESVPPHWLVYFAVDDADKTAAKAAELRRQHADAAVRHPSGTRCGARRPAGRLVRGHRAQPGHRRPVIEPRHRFSIEFCVP